MVKLEIDEFLIEFTNKGRFDVFKSIFRNEKRHSELEKELDIPGPEISRNIKRLLKKDLIRKTLDGKYQITSIGIICYEVLNILQTSINNKDFFNSHEINSIPINLILRLGNLKNVKYNDKTMENIQLWADLVKGSEKFILAISEQFQDSILPIIERKLNNQKIEIKTIIDFSMLKDSAEVGKKFQDHHDVYEKMDAFQNVRVLDKVDISLLATEKGAILFLCKDGKIDYSQCLQDNTESFIDWIRDLFRWYWKKGSNLTKFIKKK